LTELTRVVVPAIADWWAVDILEEDRSLRRIVSQGRRGFVGQPKGRYAPWPDAPSGPFWIVQTNRAQVTSVVTNMMELAVSPEPEHLEKLRQAHAIAAVCVPISFKQQVLGAMTFVRTSDFPPLQVAFCRILGHRAGQAVMHGRMYQDLQSANRRKDEFLAMLGHELRNPLGAISNAVAVLQAGRVPAESEAQIRAIINRQLLHLTKLVGDLLDVGRLTSGKIVLQPVTVDLLGVAQRCLATMQGAGRAGQHDIRVEGDSVAVIGDPVRLEQVLDNLVDNAVKYTPPQGRVRITVAARGHDAILTVRDTGIGVPDELLPRMFELFTQGPQGPARQPGGLGVGLAIVKAIVDLHGGTVHAQSPGTGGGTTVTVRLPLAGLGLLPTPTEVPGSPRAATHRILIVEDNPDARETMRLLLELSGHRVQLAEDGEAGLDLALRTHPDVALIDLGLPGLDGYELARRLRAAPEAASIRLVALTGYGQPEDRRRAAEVGFESFLVKPVDRGALDQAILASDVLPAS